jgi:hypothetical protein
MLSEENIIRIIEAVESEGGELVPETHIGEELVYEISGPHGRKVKKPTTTTACGAETLIELPVRREFCRDGDKLVALSPEEQYDTLGRFCIICDSLDLWPRFAKVVE